MDGAQLVAKHCHRGGLLHIRVCRPQGDGLASPLRMPRAPHRLEHFPRSVQHTGHHSSHARVHLDDRQQGPRRVRVQQQLRLRPHHRLLGVHVRHEQAARAHRHGVHCATQAAAHLPPLVPPRYRARLLLAVVQGLSVDGPLVHDHELLCPLDDVLVLCMQGHACQGARDRQPGDHHLADSADGRRLLRQLPGLHDQGGGSAVQHHRGEHLLVVAHVLQLLCAVRSLLHQDLCVQEAGHG